MGRAAALRLAEEGARVVLVGRRRQPLENVAAEIIAAGGAASAMPCDIGEAEAVATLFRSIADTSEGIDGLFANAGVLGQFKPLVDADLADFENLIVINVLGTFLSIKHCLPFMQGGAVVINASWTVDSVMPGAGAYAATKSALVTMMRTLAVEQGPRNIRVNSVSPGIILTPMAEDALDPSLEAKLAKHAPLNRNGTPEDVAGTVAWLLSGDAAFVTGQDIAIDGGFTIGGPRL